MCVFACRVDRNAVRQEKYVRIFREMEGEHENIQVEVLSNKAQGWQNGIEGGR